MKKITQEKYKHAKSNITMYEDSIKYQKEEIIKINNDLYMAKERLKMYEDALKRNQKIVNTYKCSLTKQGNKTEKRIKVNWRSFLSGESELECKSVSDVNKLWEVCNKNKINCDYLDKNEWLYESSYWYIKDRCLYITKYTLEPDSVCDCWTVKDYIENHTHYDE